MSVSFEFPRPGFTFKHLAVIGALLASACAPNVAAPPPASQPQPEAQPAPAPALPSTTPSAPVSSAVKVGLLLPLSGPNAAMGRAMLNAAEMGLFAFADDNFSLVVRDTAAPGGPDGAAREALADGAKLMLGPLFAADVKRAAAPVQGAHVPLVSFSNDVSAAGNGLYVLGVTPQSQVDRVVSYAAGQNLKRFAILVPNSPYGKSVLAAYQDSVTKAGGTIAQMQFYDPAAPDPTASVKSLAGTYQSGGFDALMIPEGGQKLRIMASMLPAFEIPTGSVRLLGTSLWSDPGLASEPAMAGGWFAAPPPDRWQAFAQSYQQAYGAQPDIRAGVVYDAVTLAVALAKSAPGGDFSQARLTDPSGFAGVTGIFRFNADGTTQRGLAVIEIDPGMLNVKDPAPSSFAALLN